MVLPSPRSPERCQPQGKAGGDAGESAVPCRAVCPGLSQALTEGLQVERCQGSSFAVLKASQASGSGVGLFGLV